MISAPFEESDDEVDQERGSVYNGKLHLLLWYLLLSFSI